ncbi:MAG: hypothetical protein Q9218_008201, partial [Villophora microphyllina]
MQQPGALLFRSDAARDMAEESLLNQVWPIIESLNKESQAHARISKSMLVIMPPDAPGLEKSSKGTILRAQAEKRYKKGIREAYEQGDDQVNGDQDGKTGLVPDHEVPNAVLEIIKTVIGTSDRIPEDADLFSYGVDSVACMTIRARLQSRILDPKAPALPLNVVYDYGNIKRLSGYLIDLRKGRVTELEDETQMMKELVEQYSNFSLSRPHEGVQDSNGSTAEGALATEFQVGEDEGEHVILTGATGSLGAHILHLLRSSSSGNSPFPQKISQITCLVRAASPLAAHERVSKSLLARGNPGLPPFTPSNSPNNTTNGDTPHSFPQVTCLPCTLSSRNLGLSTSTYTHLAQTTTLVIHAAWAVNFTARLRSFVKDHIAGLHNLLNLTLLAPSPTPADPKTQQQQRSRRKFLFLSSTASVTSTPAHEQPIAECVSKNPNDASPLGYSRSKWVAENICARFHTHAHTPSRTTQAPSSSQNRCNIAILRVGQLTADTVKGIWNMSEAYPLILSTAPVLRALPNLPHSPLDWLPVDVAAGAVLEVAGTLPLTLPRTVPAESSGREEEGEEVVVEGCPVFHVLNPHTFPQWSDLLSVIQAASPELEIKIVSPREWLDRLEGYEGELPAKKL